MDEELIHDGDEFADELDSDVGDEIADHVDEESNFFDELVISVLQRSGINWKWPKVKDQLFYEKDDIKMKLIPPKRTNRGVLIIPELKNHWENF